MDGKGKKTWDLRTFWLADSRSCLGDFDESSLCDAIDIPQTFLIPGVLFLSGDGRICIRGEVYIVMIHL